ncbi:hypothetical protein TRFO_35558 [Tritrichomonas foetus]|uniref:BTB domain-containing protein n=1 Tax=Tritrichomonas foetus TaxID=1144522 RepID=A0A1J4JKK3_9EUKA|nr:hypothetical protein TRFO_35558 [Tritrichomonas foetus]|eukprot:OHS98091.1 hypothetical protein TRFO_35558 [Tritrichomonas foetus]
MKSRRSTTQKNERQIFKLRCNDRQYEFPVETFAKVSKKCAALVKSNDFQGTINHPVSEEAFEAFSCACHLQQFKVTLTTAFELLDLAREWGIPTLESFVANYIKTKGIRRDESKDYLGPLIEHLNDDVDCTEDIVGVARHLNKYLVDERLYEVHPETLFKILAHADPREYDQQLFVNFAMKLFEDEPEKAVPLILLMNFDLLSLDQIEEVFQCREIHEQAMGYFIAHSMSVSRNKQQSENDLTEERHMYELQNIRDEIKKRRHAAMAKVQKEFVADTNEVRQIIEQQKVQIAKLTKLMEHQDEKINQMEQTFSRTAAMFDREILRQRQIIAKKRQLLEMRRIHIQNEYNLQAGQIRQEINDKLNDISNKNKSKLEIIYRKVNPLVNRVVKKCDTLTENGQTLHGKIEEAKSCVMDCRATLSAKIVHDQVRYSQFLRDMNTRFDPFKTDDKIWDLDADMVQEAEKIVIKLEKQVSSSCPINIRQQIKTSVDAFKALGSLFSGKKIE